MRLYIAVYVQSKQKHHLIHSNESNLNEKV